MAEPPGCHILAVMGSGETSPTMVTVHRALAARLTANRPRAILLETPYRFQENADDISARAVAYFARSVSLDVSVLTGTRPDGDSDPEPAPGRPVALAGHCAGERDRRNRNDDKQPPGHSGGLQIPATITRKPPARDHETSRDQLPGVHGW